MRTISFPTKRLFKVLKKQKIASMLELKKALGTNSSMTIFRKLKELDYISSCSHSGKYYSLMQIAQFDIRGLWLYKSVLFSTYGTLGETLRSLIEESEKGYSCVELEELLKVKPNEALLDLIKKKRIYREKVGGIYVYFSNTSSLRRPQKLLRKDQDDELGIDKMNPDILMNELKAAIIIFFSILNEKQRRLYAGLESLKIGRGGDKIISDLLGINIKTVNKGKKELLGDTIKIDTIRDSGGGRKKIQKKNPRGDSKN
jgi:hypothetical protein